MSSLAPLPAAACGAASQSHQDGPKAQPALGALHLDQEQGGKPKLQEAAGSRAARSGHSSPRAWKTPAWHRPKDQAMVTPWGRCPSHLLDRSPAHC